ncbi:MAG: PTS sugar transporter subunit IIC [Gemmatimonadaceae bacterium]|nr:PTS sugar transporter subunit IIC [Gemmatimonadaceae bacterium]
MDWLAPLLDAFPLALIAGVVGLDVVSFPQAMISRPIVAATIGGAFAGVPIAGLICGAVLECLALEALPVGASRYPEWGSASVAAGAIAAGGAPGGVFPNAGALAVSVAVGIGAAWLGGWTMVKHRQLIARFARPRLDQLAAGQRNTVIGLQVFGMTADLIRGALVGGTVFLLASPIATRVRAGFDLRDDIVRAAIVTGVAGVAAAAVWKDFHAISGTRRLFLVSLAVGTLLVIGWMR